MSVRDDLQKLLDEKADRTKASATVDGLESKEDYIKLESVDDEATYDQVDEVIADNDHLVANKTITNQINNLTDQLALVSSRYTGVVDSLSWEQYIPQAHELLTVLKEHLKLFEDYCLGFSDMMYDYVTWGDHGYNPTYDKWTEEDRGEGLNADPQQMPVIWFSEEELYDLQFNLYLPKDVPILGLDAQASIGEGYINCCPDNCVTDNPIYYQYYTGNLFVCPFCNYSFSIESLGTCGCGDFYPNQVGYIPIPLLGFPSEYVHSYGIDIEYVSLWDQGVSMSMRVFPYNGDTVEPKLPPESGEDSTPKTEYIETFLSSGGQKVNVYMYQDPTVGGYYDYRSDLDEYPYPARKEPVQECLKIIQEGKEELGSSLQSIINVLSPLSSNVGEVIKNVQDTRDFCYIHETWLGDQMSILESMRDNIAEDYNKLKELAGLCECINGM